MIPGAVTELLERWRAGDDEAEARLFLTVYRHLSRLAKRELKRERHAALDASELVHAAYERLVDADVRFEHRAHFFRLAARTMRRVLVDAARARAREKRGGGLERVTLGAVADPRSVDVPALLDLDRALAELAESQPRAVRAVELRAFAGSTYAEVAEALGVSETTVERDLALARRFLADRRAMD